MLRSPTTLTVRPDVNTRGSFQNTAILRLRPKHGRAAGSNRAGWLLPLKRVAKSKISGSAKRAGRRADARGCEAGFGSLFCFARRGRRMSGPFFRSQLRLWGVADPLTSNNPALNAARTQ